MVNDVESDFWEREEEGGEEKEGKKRAFPVRGRRATRARTSVGTLDSPELQLRLVDCS